MCLQHTVVPVRYDRIVETRYFDLVPRSAKDDITHEDFVFKSCSERARLNTFFHCSLDSAADTRHGLKLSACKLCSFQTWSEHALDESCVFVDLCRLTDQLQLLHHLELCVHFYDYSSCTDSKVGLVFYWRNSEECCSDSIHRWIEHAVTKAEFRCVLDHSHIRIRSALCFVLHRQNGDRLELAPAYGDG